MTRAVFAIPGDKDQRTGGYIYDATVLRLLNEGGCQTAHLQLPASFPDPSDADIAAALAALRAVPDTQPIIVDGLALGAMDPECVARVPAPLIALVHHPLGLETGLEPGQALALIRKEAEVLQHVAHVIVTSPHVADTLCSDFGVSVDRITVALPGLTPVLTTRTPVSPPLILSVGLLVPRKGHDVLIEALASLSGLAWQAEIVGRAQDPAYTAALRDQIARAGLETRVALLGEVDAAALQDAYQRASIFALTTRYEGYGMVLGEAMMHGLPIVSCSVGAVPDTVGSAARLVPPDSPEDAAAALLTFLEDPEAADQASQASLARATTLSTWQDTTRTVAKVIDRVTTRHPKPAMKGTNTHVCG